MNTQQMAAVRNMSGRTSEQKHLKEGSISKSEVQTLIPDINKKKLNQIFAYMQNMFRDNQVTYGEFLRLTRLIESAGMEIRQSMKMQKMMKSRDPLPLSKGKGRINQGMVTPAMTGGIDLDF